MSETDPATEPDGEEHTLIHTICDKCDSEDLLTIAEHPRDADQTRAIANAHHTIAETHADQTGHHVEVGESASDPESIIGLAKSLAPSVGGVKPGDFDGEITSGA